MILSRVLSKQQEAKPKPKPDRWQETKKIRKEINKTKSKWKIHKFNQTADILKKLMKLMKP